MTYFAYDENGKLIPGGRGQGRSVPVPPTFEGSGDLVAPNVPKRIGANVAPVRSVTRLPGRKNARLTSPDDLDLRQMEGILEWVAATSEERAAKWNAGTMEDLAVRVKVPVALIAQFLQSPGARAVAKAANQARALVALPDAIEGAIRDSAIGDIRGRNEARKFVKANVEDDSKIVNQQNTIQSWNPEDDERIVARLKDIAVEIIHEVAQASDEDGEGES